MSEVERRKWEKCINDFLVSKAEVEIERYLKEIIKKISESYKNENYFGDEEKNHSLILKKTKRGRSRPRWSF